MVTFFELFANTVHGLFFRWITFRVLIVIVTCSALGLIYIIATNGKVEGGHSTYSFAYGFARIGFGYALGLAFFRLYDADKLPILRVHWIGVAAFPITGIATAHFFPPAISDSVLIFVVIPFSIWIAIWAELPPIGIKLATILGMISYPLYALQVS